QDSETADSETQDSETADSETQDSETADSEAQDSETVDSETVDPDTEPSVCGDGVRSSDEFCDDGNHTPLDGCAPDCQPSPSCFNSGPCEQICGDGIVVGNEECDDGNREGGDGCSESCETEADYTCSTGCIGINCTVSLKVYYRDFVEDDEDFQNDACGGGEEGTVENLLDAMGKPVASSIAANQCIFNLDKWYAGVPDISGELRLYRRFSPNTAYVNRYGENGEKWRDLMGKTYNGTPVFFPVDDLNTDMAPADIPPEYNSSGNWVLESDFVENASNHNFYFTSEMIYWFEYVKGADASIEIIGDDDVWVFVNGHLAIDLGGTHVPKSGSVTLDTPTASRFGLSDGNVYAIRIFHAERKKTGSTMQIQLDKIKSVQSVCAPSSTVIPPWNP
ncbi:MAG: fibro-slime domain-containing protein, partial [Deltaproteobacteria bacterium]|nr:fibro-slime domain-containing protein [Deltaproteobacteria bacterium]